VEQHTYTVVILHEQDGRYSAVVPALECATWGHTIPEALRRIEEALTCHLETLQAAGEPIPSDPAAFTFEMGDALDAVVYRVSVPRQEAARVA
jgi:predicted RNase H-like HicB family nuclease